MAVTIQKRLRVYPSGAVVFQDERLARPVSFAHIADLHLPPPRPQAWPPEYREAIGWWDRDFNHPLRVLPLLLDQIQAAGADFIFFGGDNIDCCDAEAAEHLIALCGQRHIPCYFQFGNHDYESLHVRYITHDIDDESRARNTEQLCRIWNMPGRYYSFDVGGARFVAADTLYGPVEGGYGGRFGREQTDWIIDQFHHEGPVIFFHHVPFVVPANRDRLLLAWNGIKGWMAEDQDSLRVQEAIKSSANVLGTFAGHTHVRSEDPIGDRWQFVTAAGGLHQWRYVRIGAEPPPKSLAAEGRPLAEGLTEPVACES